MPERPQSPRAPDLPRVDLRSLKPADARSRAFSGMFRIRPGQKVHILVSTPDVEREIMKWVDEIGHRFLRRHKVEDNGASHVALELMKMEARR